jgi:peptidoglycan/xylan/chitin deacetylase (PgdA/CDA1 family)
MALLCHVKKSVRRITDRLYSRAVILLYHRVTNLETDPQLLCVSPTRFAEHLQILRGRYHPIPLTQLAHSLQSHRVPRNAVVVTFDDGYADNLLEAKPLLERHEIPATFFITSGHVNQRGEFWWDELERLIQSTERLPSELELVVDDVNVAFEFRETENFPPEGRPKMAGWHVEKPDNPTERHKLYRRLCQVIKPMAPAARERALQYLRAWAGDAGVGRPSHRALTRGELKELAAAPLVEIGAHTVNHPALSALDFQSQAAEIVQSKAQLEAHLGRPVSSFSYPFGGGQDYTAETVSLVRAAGFACACSNVPGLVRQPARLFELPRCLVRDWDGEAFERNLKRIFIG